MERFVVIETGADESSLPKSAQPFKVVELAEAEQIIPSGSEVAAYLPDGAIRQLIALAHQKQWVLSLLRHPKAQHAARGFVLANKTALFDEAQSKKVAMDILHCNDQIVLNKVVVGRAFAFQPGGHSAHLWARLKTVWHQLRHLTEYQPQAFKLATSTSTSEIDVAAIGVVATTHVQGSNLSKQLLTEADVNDSMFYSVLVAPRSLMQMLRYFVAEPFVRNVRQPGFIGVVRSSASDIKSAQPFEYRIDEQSGETQLLSLQCHAAYVELRVPEDSCLTNSPARAKEIRRVQPVKMAAEAIQSLVSKPLPWITHAAKDDFKELYQQLRDNAKPSPAFLVFMVLATLLASLGLYANSAPVIIGAMILAPLMAPIVSLAMALARQDEALLVASSKTLMVGFLLAIGCSTLLSWCLPLQIETAEISARLRPTLLDLGIAIISGIAGAYANARSEAAKSLAGVAIAVALVPPLAVAGIGLGWMAMNIAMGALLLFLTNLAGIVFAASATFLLMGFAPFSRARHGIFAALVAVALVSFPLALSFNQLAREAGIVASIEQVQLELIEIRSVQVVSIRDNVRLRIEVVGQQAQNSAAIHQLKAAIEQRLGQPTTLEVQWISQY